jgi:hypothetical protein
MRLRTLWRNLVHRERVDRDLEDELRAYVIVGSGVVAASVPARRALRTDPVVALKSE